MQNEFGLHGANLFAITISRNCDRAIHIAERRCFKQCECRNALASCKLESVSNERIVLVAANLDFVGIVLAVVRELCFYRLFPDNSIQMSRSNNRKLIVRDDGIELLLSLSNTKA